MLCDSLKPTACASCFKVYKTLQFVYEAALVHSPLFFSSNNLKRYLSKSTVGLGLFRVASSLCFKERLAKCEAIYMKMTLYSHTNVLKNSQERFWIQLRFGSEGFGTRNGQLKFVFPTVGKIILKYWLRALRERCLEHRTQGPSCSCSDYLIQGASDYCSKLTYYP